MALLVFLFIHFPDEANHFEVDLLEHEQLSVKEVGDFLELIGLADEPAILHDVLRIQVVETLSQKRDSLLVGGQGVVFGVFVCRPFEALNELQHKIQVLDHDYVHELQIVLGLFDQRHAEVFAENDLLFAQVEELLILSITQRAVVRLSQILDHVHALLQISDIVDQLVFIKVQGLLVQVHAEVGLEFVDHDEVLVKLRALRVALDLGEKHLIVILGLQIFLVLDQELQILLFIRDSPMSLSLCV